MLTKKAPNVKALYAGLLNQQQRTGRPLPGNMSSTQPMMGNPQIQAKIRPIGSKFPSKPQLKGQGVGAQGEMKRSGGGHAKGGPVGSAQASKGISKVQQIKAMNIQAMRRVG